MAVADWLAAGPSEAGSLKPGVPPSSPRPTVVFDKSVEPDGSGSLITKIGPEQTRRFAQNIEHCAESHIHHYSDESTPAGKYTQRPRPPTTLVCLPTACGRQHHSARRRGRGCFPYRRRPIRLTAASRG